MVLGVPFTAVIYYIVGKILDYMLKKRNIPCDTEDYVMLRRSEMFLSNMRFFFEKGAFRFKDLKCKQAVLKALSY